MQRFSFPDTLPPCPGILPAFKERFSGWHLGMGLPDTLAGLIQGLSTLGRDIPACNNVVAGMALWAMQAHPLSPSALHNYNLVSAQHQLSPRLRQLSIHMAAAPQLSEADTQSMETWHATVRQDDRSLILRFLTIVLGSKNSLAWFAHCWQDMLYLGMPEVPKAGLDMLPNEEANQPLKARLEAEWAFHFLPPEEALPIVEALDPEVWGLWRAYAAGELLLRMGKGKGKAVLSMLWKTIPWHVNLTLKLHDIFNPTPLADETETTEVAILLYSWNKADLLADTLASLAESDIGHAKVFALNNGSSDHTADVLRQARDQFGEARFHIETLPVNVGAPAARNWLLSLPEVRARSWSAFLDDDVVLPKEWLLHLLGAARGQTNVGAVGCRITAATAPFGLQSADYNLFPTPPAQTEPGALPNRVLLFDNCAGATDTGLFTYTRPCLSVSGCCHLISMAAIEKAGMFDLRYTPSQFDDLDRDLRSALSAMPAFYTGSLAIKHVQHSSLAKSQTARQIGHVMGNKFKLDTKYTDDELARLGTENKERLWGDLQTKYDYLVDLLG